MKLTPWYHWVSLSVCAALVACASPASKPSDEPPAQLEPVKPAKPVDLTALKEQALTDALAIYADGRYDDAVARLTELIGASELPLASQIKVLKFIAFSHCAMGRPKPCRQHFDLALEQDPTFQLTEAERGHPVWGKEFLNARLALRGKRPSPKSP